MKKYKYITILQEDGETFNGKPIYRITNNRSKAELGIIYYYPTWKEYVFLANQGCVFNNSCLADVLDFINEVIPQANQIALF